MRNLRSERGIALLATMMAVALMIVMVVDFTYSATEGYRSAANQMNELRSDYLARSGVQVGMALLSADALIDQKDPPPNDSLQEIWATPFPPIPVEGGAAGVSIVDEARKLNINQLVDPGTGTVNQEVAAEFSRLFSVTSVPPEILPALIDWLDRDSVTSRGGAEADYYLRLVPPYEPRNGPMPTIGDLKMIRGVDEPSFMKLKQFLTVAPEVRINVNTAPPEVLVAKMAELANDASLVKNILQIRSIKPFKTVLELSDVPGLSAVSGRLPSLFTTQSNYFTITGLGTYAGTRKLVYAMVLRRGSGGPIMLANWHED